jgi:23S rRNA pseudouridine1911/1915/1917 synthase
MANAPPCSSSIQILTFVVERNYAGWRLDRYLKQKIRRATLERIQEIVANDVVSEMALEAATPVWPGLTFQVRRRVLDEPSVPPIEALREVFLDDEIVVIDKPSGLPIHATARYANNTLTAQLKIKYAGQENPRVDPAHRLDRETSGLVICGRTLSSCQHLMKQFHDGNVHKEYLALVEGHPKADAFEVNAPIAPGTALVRIAVRIDREVGREAITQFQVESRFENQGVPFALVRCFPRTGRQHQIRIHLKTAGHSLVGDKMYGPDALFFDRFSKGQLEEAAWTQLRLKRHALHAAVLCLEHPVSKVPIYFRSPLPSDLTAFLEGHTHPVPSELT